MNMQKIMCTATVQLIHQQNVLIAGILVIKFYPHLLYKNETLRTYWRELDRDTLM